MAEVEDYVCAGGGQIALVLCMQCGKADALLFLEEQVDFSEKPAPIYFLRKAHEQLTQIFRGEEQRSSSHPRLTNAARVVLASS